MSLEAQAKLLRALESSEFERVGGTRTLTFDARIIAATNKDLHQEVAEGRFRRDLFYRLNVLPITVPPLRERAEDISLLAEHYLTYFRREYGRPKVKLTADATRLLTRASWPGNVRELRNVIERLVIMAVDDAIGPAEVLTLCGDDPGLAGLGRRRRRGSRGRERRGSPEAPPRRRRTADPRGRAGQGGVEREPGRAHAGDRPRQPPSQDAPARHRAARVSVAGRALGRR